MNDPIVLATEDSDGKMNYAYQHFCDLNGIEWREGMPKLHIREWGLWMRFSSEAFRDKIYMQVGKYKEDCPF